MPALHAMGINGSFFNFSLQLRCICCRSECYSHVSLCEVNPCCMLVSCNKERGREEEEKIDVDLDFEEVKSTKYITQFMRRPVAETDTKKGRIA